MKERKKILLVITKADIGGAQNHVNHLAKYLSDCYEMILCSGSNEFLLQRIVDHDVRSIVLSELKAKTLLPGIINLHRLIKSEQPDLIHTHSAIASFVSRIAGRLAGVKTLYTVHGWHFVPNSVWKRRVFGWFLELVARPFTTAWITVSDYDLNLGVESGVIDLGRAWMIPNGVDDVDLPRVRSNSDQLRLVFVGRASYQKNCMEAVDILQACGSRVSLAMFVTSGDHLDALKARIIDSGLSDRVSVIADNPDASSALYKYDAILLTSRYEGMPLCVLEAMRSGLAVVASDVCGMKEIVAHGETGFLYKLGHIEQAAERINMLSDAGLLEKFSKNAREKFIKNHRAEVMAQRTAEVYEVLLGEN